MLRETEKINLFRRESLYYLRLRFNVAGNSVLDRPQYDFLLLFDLYITVIPPDYELGSYLIAYNLNDLRFKCDSRNTDVRINYNLSNQFYRRYLQNRIFRAIDPEEV